MTTSDCDEFGPLVEAWRDGFLPDEQARLVEEHIAGCAECSGSPEQELLDFVEEFKFEPGPGDRWRSVLVPAPAQPRRFFAFVALAAAMVAGLLFSLTIGAQEGRPLDAGSPAAPAGASYGSFGSGTSTVSSASPPGRPSVTIFSEGDVALDVSNPDRSQKTESDR